MKHELKSKIQEECLDKARKVNYSMVVAATGVGKSKIAVDYAKEIVKENPLAKILIIVPTEKLRDENWKEEFKKWEADGIWANNIDRSCYVSANKYIENNYDLVILDEIHNITPNNALFFSQNVVHKAIGLTATLPSDLEKTEILFNELDFQVVKTISLEQAVELGLVSPYNIKVIEVDLNNKDKDIKAGNKAKPFFQTEYAAYKYLDSTINRMMFSRSPALKFKLLQRMRFIYNLESKTKAAEYLLENVIPEQERTIIFSGGIKQAERLNEHYFHSKTNDADLNSFKEGEINRLSCVNSLNEGHNIANLDNALVVQLNSKELNLVQRIGRVIRYREGHEATIYILMASNTQDEKWVNKALANFDKSKIEFIRYKNLVNNNVNI